MFWSEVEMMTWSLIPVVQAFIQTVNLFKLESGLHKYFSTIHQDAMELCPSQRVYVASEKLQKERRASGNNSNGKYVPLLLRLKFIVIRLPAAV